MLGTWAVLAATLLPAASPPPDLSRPLGVDECVALALGRSPAIGEAEARVREYQARLAEIQAVYYPKLQGLALLAPMFSVQLDRPGDIDSYRYEWQEIGAWGPYTSLQAILAQPLYTFGRAEAGERAAAHLVEVQRARVREAQGVVAVEVHRFYHLRLHALAIQPALQQAQRLLATAQEEGQRSFAEATGKVTRADLAKLDYAGATLEKMLLTAQTGATLALAALKHTLALPADAPLQLADATLPQIDEGQPLPELAELLQVAAQQCPEWAQLDHGRRAALSWEEAERLAKWPVVAVAGQLRASWTPTRHDSPNPYHNDPYNELFGGVGLALQFDIDPAKASARARQAAATGEQVDALRRFAETGIPMQVRLAHQTLAQQRATVGLDARAERAARKWMTFAGAAYSTGTGEAKDLIEGLVAYLQAKAALYEGLAKYWIARAELDRAVGRVGASPPAPEGRRAE